MNIYIYGAKDFKKSVSSILSKADINDGVETINSLSRLKTTIQETPREIFIIDESKIFEENFLNKKFSFLRPKDAIEKSFLKEHGVGDICFHSVDGIVTYLKNRFETPAKENPLEEEPEIIQDNEDNIEEIEEDELVALDEDIQEENEIVELEEEIPPKDSTEIEDINEIEDFHIQEVVSELETKN